MNNGECKSCGHTQYIGDLDGCKLCGSLDVDVIEWDRPKPFQYSDKKYNPDALDMMLTDEDREDIEDLDFLQQQ